VREMADALALDLVAKRLSAKKIVLTIGYDVANLTDPKISTQYTGDITTDRYGRRIPKHSHGTHSLASPTNSAKIITEAAVSLFDRIVNPILLQRRLTIVAAQVVPEGMLETSEEALQFDLFTDPAAQEEKRREEESTLARERRMQEAVLEIKQKYGKNALVKGMNLEEGATAISRNGQIGGHKA